MPLVDDTEAGLANLEVTLGISPVGDVSARIDAIVCEVALKVEAWERMTPKGLLRDSEKISAIFLAGERAEMFAYMHDGHLPDCWYGLLLYRIGPDLWVRFMDQMARDTHAQMARMAGAEERSLGGKARASNDPRQRAKAEAFQFWKERRAGDHPKLRTNEQFAMECMRRWPILKSAKVILGWCTEWNKQARKSQAAS